MTPAVESTKFADYVQRHRLYGKFGYDALDFRCRYIFRDVGPIDGKNMLDIGGGTGLLSAWAVANGAQRATNLEPELAGSSNGMMERFRMTTAVEETWAERLTACSQPIQDYGFQQGPFDLVLSHSSINHLNEDDCIRLLDSESAQKEYLRILTRIREALAPGGWMVVSDAGRVNYWNRLGLKSPFAPMIEWHKHHEPKVWRRLFEEAGFETVSVRWQVYLPHWLRFLSRLCANRVIARMTGSVFIITFRNRRPGLVVGEERGGAAPAPPRSGP